MISFTALILAGQMLLDGLCARWFGKLCLLQPETTILRIMRGPIYPHEPALGWPYVLLALAWIGALAALWLGKPWSAAYSASLGGISAALSVVGWVLAVIIIVGALHPATSQWLSGREAT